MAKDLLFEIGCEELPASFVRPALADMARVFTERAKEARLAHGELRTWGTPRRLALLVKDVAESQEDLSTEVLGPPVKVAFDAEGKPTAVAEKWAAGQNVKVDALERKETPKGQYVYIDRHEKGQKADKVLPELLLGVLKGIALPKSMRWGWEEEGFLRPVQWMVALHGSKALKLQYADVKSGNTTRGHRFLSKKPIKLDDPARYLEALAEGHVVADQEKRKELVRGEVEAQAREVGGSVLEDPELLETVTFLVEQPTGIWGSFDREFLDLPPEVLVSEARGHQKYFSVKGADGKLMPNFVAVSNMPVKDKAIARAGYERVLRARLSDARFFFTEDQKRPLASRVDDLKRVVFQEKLGTSYEKMERFRSLAVWLAEHVGVGAPTDTSINHEIEAAVDPAAGEKQKLSQVVARAAYLCKADLVTGMVGEFPELQGVMGREYTKGSEDPEVSLAIYEHYLPRGATDVLPSRDAGALVGIADRLDTLVGIFGIGRKPTGAADPFGLRRACIAIINLILGRGYRMSLSAAIDKALDLLGPKVPQRDKTRADVLDFIRGRLENLWAENHRKDVVDAVLAAGFDDIVDARTRLEAMSAIVGQADFEPLAVTFKRVVNIIEKQAKGLAGREVDPAVLQEPPEQALFEAFQAARGRVEQSIRSSDYPAALREITALKPAVDHFFDKVLVMAEDPKVKENRLALLLSIGKLFGGIANFARIQAGEQAKAA